MESEYAKWLAKNMHNENNFFNSDTFEHDVLNFLLWKIKHLQEKIEKIEENKK